MPYLVHYDQTGLIKSRLVSDNVRLLASDYRFCLQFRRSKCHCFFSCWEGFWSAGMVLPVVCPPSHGF